MFRPILLAAAATLLSFGAAHAATVDVKVLNMAPHGGGMFVFEPSLVRIAPGDSVHFIAADKGHNVESIPGMAPDGAAPIAGKMNEDITVAFDKPGVYGVRCKPHYGMGMVAMVVVGNPVNEDAAKSVSEPGKAKQVFAKLFQQLDENKTAAK